MICMNAMIPISTLGFISSLFFLLSTLSFHISRIEHRPLCRRSPDKLLLLFAQPNSLFAIGIFIFYFCFSSFFVRGFVHQFFDGVTFKAIKHLMNVSPFDFHLFVIDFKRNHTPTMNFYRLKAFTARLKAIRFKPYKHKHDIIWMVQRREQTLYAKPN